MARAKPVFTRDIRQEVLAGLSARSRYGAIDYDYDKDCSGCTDDTYHRHCRIINFKVRSVDVPAISKEIRSPVTEPFLGYSIDRLVTKAKLWEQDSWEPDISQGYYGEELSSVTFVNPGSLQDQICRVWDLKEKEKIEFVLMDEYGFLIDRVKKATGYEIRNVSPSKLVLPNEDYSRRIDTDIVESYVKGLTDYNIPIGIFYEKLGQYHVIDGYHRTMAAVLRWQDDRTKTFDIIVTR